MTKRKFLSFFMLFCVIGFLVVPNLCYSEEYELEKTKAINILNSSQHKLVDEWINMTTSPDFSSPEKQAALFLVRSGIQKKELSYCFVEIPKEYLEKIIKVGASLILKHDISSIIDKIEKETVEKAVQIVKDWLSQNELKIANGPLKFKYISYKKNVQEPKFHYLINYRYLGNDKSNIVEEFYCPEEVEPLKGTSSIMWLGRSPWDIEEWLERGNTKLSPFIVKITGGVNELYTGGFVWDDSSKWK